MLDFSISVVPFIVVAIANFVLSWLYYSPAVPWFKAWQISAGIDPDKSEMTEEDKKALPRLFGGAILASLLLPYGLQVFVHSIAVTTFLGGVLAVWG